jgi:hypothetical protein
MDDANLAFRKDPDFCLGRPDDVRTDRGAVEKTDGLKQFDTGHAIVLFGILEFVRRFRHMDADRYAGIVCRGARCHQLLRV